MSDLPAPPLHVTALVPRTLLRGVRPGYWLLITNDGRGVLTFAYNADDAARLVTELLPDAKLTQCTLVRSEVGTPLM